MNYAPVSRFALPLLAVTLSAFLSGCGGKDEKAGANHGGDHKHEHRAPHGGTAIVLGKEAFHLELVRTAEAGLLTCYILDGHMESFIRIPSPHLSFETTVSNQTQNLELLPVANAATGEKSGDTSQFEAHAAWLKTTTNFTGKVSGITIKGTTFTDIKFRFPEGNE
jgi:hypothetical protein